MKLILTDRQHEWLYNNAVKLDLETIKSKLDSDTFLLNFNKSEIATIKHLATEFAKGLKDNTIPTYEKRIVDNPDKYKPYLDKANSRLKDLETLLSKIRAKGRK